ncbi:MAG TPA: ribose-5-phosphate isomerase RpiA [Ktedonobacterales bacterium]|nr:ribose-5-phosphate isomerase RpiA [Ktedonobacterales bacterium]
MADDERMAWKQAAAGAAAANIPDGGVIGLGSGSTAELMLRALAERVRAGLRVTGIATSARTRALAGELGIAVMELDDLQGALDMSLDGADEVTTPALDLIKGRGGALLHEKQVALASRFRVIIIDETKLVTALGMTVAVPVEVIAFGWRQTALRLTALGCQPTLRRQDDISNIPFVTDSGNYILDCAFGAIAQPAMLAAELKAVTGVVDHGLFVGMTDRVYVGGAAGVVMYDAPSAGAQR